MRGKRSIDYPAQGNPYNTLPPSERRDIWDVGTVYGRTLTYPLRFNTWGTRETCYLGTHAQAFLKKETFEVRFEPVSCRRRHVRRYCYPRTVMRYGQARLPEQVESRRAQLLTDGDDVDVPFIIFRAEVLDQMISDNSGGK